MKRCRVVFAGGKTGGHLFPGVAMAEYIERKMNNKIEIIFVGIKGGLEERVIPTKNWKLEFIPMTTPRVGGIWGVLKFFLYAFPVSLGKSFAILIKYRPVLVFALGGYSGFPVAFAGWLMRIPVVIIEQNVYMGLTNKVLSLIATKIFLPFDIVGRSRGKYVVSGNPVRELNVVKKNAGDKFTIGILGGSQGARGLNQLIEKLLPHMRDLRDRVNFIHQVGKQSVESTRALYEKLGFEAKVIDFIDDMGWFYGNVDLLITRAGASTIAELISIGKGAIFVPFPYAADDHQRKNALYLQEKGAGILFSEDDSPEKLSKIIHNFYEDREKLSELDRAAKTLFKGDSREIIWKNIKVYLEKLCLEK